MSVELNSLFGYDNGPIYDEPLSARPDYTRRRVSMVTAGLLLLALMITVGHWLYFDSTQTAVGNVMLSLQLNDWYPVAG